jgi:hypothetical protein
MVARKSAVYALAVAESPIAGVSSIKNPSALYFCAIVLCSQEPHTFFYAFWLFFSWSLIKLRTYSLTNMPGKVIDAMTILGAASVGSTLDVTTSVTTAALKVTTGASAGKYLQSDASGNATWATVDGEWGMKFAQSDENAPLTLTKADTKAVITLTAAAAVTLPTIDVDVAGRMYLIINTHTAANTVTANGTQKIDSAGSPGSISLPALGGKVLLVAGSAAEGWFTI